MGDDTSKSVGNPRRLELEGRMRGMAYSYVSTVRRMFEEQNVDSVTADSFRLYLRCLRDLIDLELQYD